MNEEKDAKFRICDLESPSNSLILSQIEHWMDI